MGKFSSDKDFAKRVSMHRDPEQHKKRDDNKKRGDNPNARRNKYKEQNNALNSRKDEHEKWGYELLNRKEQIFNQNKTTEEKAKTAAAEENKAAANAASVLSDKEIGEELNRLTAAFRATNGEKEEGELRAFAALHHLNLRVGTAVSKTDKSVIARMVFNGGVEKPMGNYSPKFADIANYPYKYAGTPGKAEDYDLESSTVWQAMKEEPRLAEMQDKLKAALAKAGVPKEILPEMNINDFKYLMFNHCAAQKSKQQQEHVGMTMQELIDYLKQNEEIGRNRPTSEVKIAIGVLKLKEAGFPEPAAEYHTLLRNFNGLSNNGCFILGINTESSFFPDILDYNVREKENLAAGELVLGYNDAFRLIYDAENKKYRFVDPDDGSEEGATESLAEAVPYILHV